MCFSSAKAPTPQVPAPPPTPPPVPQSNVAKAVTREKASFAASNTRDKLRKGASANSTILTSPLGAPASGAGKTLLGA